MTDSQVILRSRGLTINDVVQVARFGAQVKLTEEKEILQRVEASHNYITEAARSGKPIFSSIYSLTQGPSGTDMVGGPNARAVVRTKTNTR